MTIHGDQVHFAFLLLVFLARALDSSKYQFWMTVRVKKYIIIYYVIECSSSSNLSHLNTHLSKAYDLDLS